MKHIYIATGVTALVGGLITAAMVSSCDTECTMEARASVVLQFINTATDGPEPELLGASEVWFDFTDDNGQTETLRGQCMDDECTEWVLGFERPGTYAVHATVCGQEYNRELSVGMTEDGCHVETAWEQIEVDGSRCPPDLEPADELRPPGSQCSLEARYSVIVDVVGDIEGRDHPIATDRSYFKWSGNTDPRQWPGSCLNEDCSKFAAGVEQEGHFEVGAEVCGEVIARPSRSRRPTMTATSTPRP